MKVKVKNFGAIKDGEFDIKDLTIFIGDNDSGKSFIAKFVYVLIKYLQDTSQFFYKNSNYLKYESTKTFENIKKFYKYLNTQANRHGKYLNNFFLDEKFMQLLIECMKKSFYFTLKNAIEIYFSNNFNELININESKTTIEIFTKYLNIFIFIEKDKNFDIKVNFKELKELKYKINLEVTKESYFSTQSNVEFLKDSLNTNIKISIGYMEDEANIDEFYYIFSEVISSTYFSLNYFSTSYIKIDYFPANKSAIVSNYNSKFQKDINLAENYIHYNESAKKDNYIVNDFIHLLRSFTNEILTQNFKHFQSYEFLKNQIDGEIFFDNNRHLNYELKSNENSLNISIENLSTKLTELTPLLLYLERLNLNDNASNMLIIEEPEAHLNPKMQRVMARLLVMMMNEGIKVLITTHSDYILNEMDILLKLNHIKEKNSQKYSEFIKNDSDYEELMELDKDKISIYRFIKNGIDTEIENIKVSKNKIFEKEFEETSENLYSENSKVIDILKSL